MKVHIQAKSAMIQTGKPASKKFGQLDQISIQKICTCFSFFQKKEGTIGGGCVWIMQITYFHSSRSFMLTQKQEVNYTNYHCYYSPAPSGGPQATEEGAYDASESEDARTQVQRAFMT
jgi:hypothetical protein